MQLRLHRGHHLSANSAKELVGVPGPVLQFFLSLKLFQTEKIPKNTHQNNKHFTRAHKQKDLHQIGNDGCQ